MPLRPATPSDAAPLAALSIEVWLTTYLKAGVSKHFAEHVLTTYTADAFHAAMDDAAQTLIVSEAEDGPDAYIRLVSNAPPPLPACRGAEIATLYVRPHAQGRGLGRALVHEGRKACKAQGIDAVWLTVNAENARARAFYDRLGFTELGTTDFVIDGTSYPNVVLGLDLTRSDLTGRSAASA